jgi:quinol monooxygenase YgiN
MGMVLKLRLRNSFKKNWIRFMLLFLLKITPLPRQRRETLEILRSVQEPTASQLGCLACEIYEAVGDDPAILYMERWESLEAVQHHIQSSLYTKILAAMDMSAKYPDIHFFDISELGGLDFVESLRSPGRPLPQEGEATEK